MPIQYLDPVTITKISAGEVIDRPASIVKELLENSLDSGASRIVIDIENGGKQLIRITDNGIGIAKEDLPLAPLCHTTSKIHCLEDIYHNLLFGFRGEALASVSHVAKLSISSKTQSQEIGYVITSSQDVVSELQPVSHPIGTTVEVRDVFWDMPVRQKFLKSDSTELSHIYDVVVQACLGHPLVEIVLRHQGKQMINTSGLNRLEDVIVSLFGKDYIAHLLPIAVEINDVGIRGIVSSPAWTFSNRSRQWLFVNQRPIKNAVLQKAIQQVFADRIPSGRHPFLVADVTMMPQHVDINIHPQKQDVRFLNTGHMFDTFRQALTHHLEAIPASFLPASKPDLPVYEGRDSFRFDRSSQESPPSNMSLFSPHALSEYTTGSIPYLHIYQTYIVLDTVLGVAILDQHAVHERILYDKIKSDFQKTEYQQSLLIAEHVHLTPDKMAVYEASRDIFQKIGIETEIFGPSEIVVRAMPHAYADVCIEPLILDLLEASVESGSLRMEEPLKKWQMVACKAAIKAGKRMKESEIQHLLKDLIETPSRYTCPHGRPLCVFLGKPELEKLFLRR